MYKTTWYIKIDGKDEVRLAYYHFGTEPEFPKWYMEEDHFYNIEMVWNHKLIATPKIFWKCLFNAYVIS